jgi:hypothetical protein
VLLRFIANVEGAPRRIVAEPGQQKSPTRRFNIQALPLRPRRRRGRADTAYGWVQLRQ